MAQVRYRAFPSDLEHGIIFGDSFHMFVYSYSLICV